MRGQLRYSHLDKARKMPHPISNEAFSCAPTRTRTWNPLIKSQLLYQLSHGCRTPGNLIAVEPEEEFRSESIAVEDPVAAVGSEFLLVR